jgi:hypothetical protein
METGDTGLAATLLAQLQGLELVAGERARIEFLSGVASARSGAIEAADQIWRMLEHDGPVDVRIDAAFARTELLLAAGELKPAEAIARLAPTRGLWPGRPREEAMLRGLGADPCCRRRPCERALHLARAARSLPRHRRCAGDHGAHACGANRALARRR